MIVVEVVVNKSLHVMIFSSTLDDFDIYRLHCSFTTRGGGSVLLKFPLRPTMTLSSDTALIFLPHASAISARYDQN